MKIRTDYVSNSSSSSFIIGNSKILEKFNIDKNEIINTFKALLPENEHKYFRVYDMHDKNDVNDLKEIKGCLQGWCCSNSYIDNNTGKLTSGNNSFVKWNDFKNSFLDAFRIYYYSDSDIDKIERNIWKYDKNGNLIGCKRIKAQKWIIDTIKKFRNEIGIIDNWEAAHRPEARFVVHFDDNIIWDIKDISTCGMFEQLETPWAGKKTLNKYQKNKNDEIKNSIWNTEGYSVERICEILMKYWVETGKIDKNDLIFVNLFGTDEMNSKNPNIFHLLFDDIISFNGHEG